MVGGMPEHEEGEQEKERHHGGDEIRDHVP